MTNSHLPTSYGTSERTVPSTTPQLTASERDLLQSDTPGYGHRSPIEVAFNLVNATLGAGIIGLAYAILSCGVILGTIVALVVAFMTYISLYMMILVGKKNHLYQVAQLAQFAVGKHGFHLYNFFVFFQLLGVTTSYFILIGDSMPVLFQQYFPDLPLLANRVFVISIISWVFIFPLHLSRSIGTIANWSIVSVLLLPVILLTVIIRCPAYASEHASPVTVVGSDVLGSLGIMAFAFGCAQVAFSNFLSLKDQSAQSWSRTTAMATSLSLILALGFGYIGYFTFGVDVQANMFLNFSPTDPVINFGRLALAISLILTIPTAFYPAREALQMMLGFDSRQSRPNSLQHILITFLLFAVMVTLGIKIHSLGKVYGVVGGVTATLLNYMMPGCAYLRAFAFQRWTKADSEESTQALLEHNDDDIGHSLFLEIIAIGLLVVGSFVMVVSVYCVLRN
ncbi:transmembrane amino acid transporter protein-domain-containing protein [Umbelopsis sp. PMI_123]|nr:transmembrane amino acid transporter protein-domain-containing protein [Umbelopsis sp. PMI_123]